MVGEKQADAAQNASTPPTTVLFTHLFADAER